MEEEVPGETIQRRKPRIHADLGRVLGLDGVVGLAEPRRPLWDLPRARPRTTRVRQLSTEKYTAHEPVDNSVDRFSGRPMKWVLPHSPASACGAK